MFIDQGIAISTPPRGWLLRCCTIMAGVAVLCLTLQSERALAFESQSTNYGLHDGVINSFGGSTTSTGYQLTDSGGEPFVGPASSTNYKFNAGYVAQLERSIALGVSAASVSMNAVPGSPQTAETTLSVLTESAGYVLAVAQDHDLRHTDNTTTIPAISGTIASPALWVDGTTVGLGFTLVSGTGLDGKWGTSPNFKYAAFPASATDIHTKSGYQGTADETVVRYGLDVAATQKSGTYANKVTYTATSRL